MEPVLVCKLIIHAPSLFVRSDNGTRESEFVGITRRGRTVRRDDM